jgi:hypothetical protein
MTTRKPLFKLGQTAATPGALGLAEDLGINFLGLLARHVTGDFGDLCEDDLRENRNAIENGFRVFSAYEFAGGKFWVITEADRSVTTILLPEEY